MSNVLNETDFAVRVREIRAADWVRNHQQRKPNFWDIIEYGSRSYENRNSRMLRWLLDPNADHGLGSRFAHALVQEAASAGTDEHSASATAGVTIDVDGDTSQVTVQVEVGVETVNQGRMIKGRIDLLYLDPAARRLIAIENKTGSTEHTMGLSGDVSQLDGYREWLCRSYPDYDGLFVYLTPQDAEPAATPGWVTVSHQALFAAYDELAESVQDNYHVRKIIQDFRYDLARKLDRTLTDSAGQILFADYDAEKKIQDLIPANAMWGVMWCLPQDIWGPDDDAPTGGSDAAYARWWSRIRQETRPELSSELVSRIAAEVGDGCTPAEVRSLALLVWEHRPRRGADQTRSPELTALMRRIFTHLTGVAAPYSAVRMAPLTDEIRSLLPRHVSIEKIEQTTNGGQGLWIRVGDGVAYKLQGSASSKKIQSLFCIRLGQGKPTLVTRDGAPVCPSNYFAQTTVQDWGTDNADTVFITKITELLQAVSKAEEYRQGLTNTQPHCPQS